MLLLLIVSLIIINFALFLLYRAETNRKIKKTKEVVTGLLELLKDKITTDKEYVQRNNDIQLKMFSDYAGFQNEIMRYLKLEFGEDRSQTLQKIQR